MAQLTKQELNSLIGVVQELAELDIDGITVTDVRHSIASWLDQTVNHKTAKHFEEQVLDFQAKIDDEVGL